MAIGMWFCLQTSVLLVYTAFGMCVCVCLCMYVGNVYVVQRLCNKSITSAHSQACTLTLVSTLVSTHTHTHTLTHTRADHLSISCSCGRRLSPSPPPLLCLLLPGQPNGGPCLCGHFHRPIGPPSSLLTVPRPLSRCGPADNNCFA